MVRTISCAAILGLLAACASADPTPATQPAMASTAAATQPTVDPLADQILRQSCDFLAQTKAFSVQAEVWKDEVLASGHKIQVTREIELDVQRPDRLHLDARAHQKGRSIWYDGKSLTVMDRERSLYSVVDAPSTIDQTLDLLSGDYGITVPLEDLAVADPYANAMKNVTDGGYFGDEPVLGVRCRHIGFSTDRIDWQLWIAEGPQPLPQKLVITYKTEEQQPQYIAIFTKWTVLDHASDSAFTFIPPNGASPIPMVSQRKTGTQP